MVLQRRNESLVAPTQDESFEATFTRYYPLVYQLAYRCTGRSDEADDIAQEVFLRFYRIPPHAPTEGEQRAWLCRVATNLSLNALRAQQRRTHHEEQAGDRATHNGPDSVEKSLEEHLLAAEQAALIRSVLAELPEKQQTYILLRSVGSSYAEIAQATGVALASVGSLLGRAEREFRRRYNERTATLRAE